jgi:alkaline phosphatase D
MNRKSVSRRGFIAGTSALGVAVRGFAHEDDRPGSRDPAVAFRHGVASGDPLADRVILWTRVTTPNPSDFVRVAWRVARDARMRKVVCSGQVWTDASRDFTVKVDACDLKPHTTYYYQFFTKNAASPIGRTKTLPVAAARSLRFALVSCSNYPYGFFHVYGRIAERSDLDFVLHVGDYLYEYQNGAYGDGAPLGRIPLPDREIVALSDYRLRHATYKSDPDLQEIHRQPPFITVWDDHESANDAWRDGAENHDPELGEGEWEARKRASIRAYFEWMPIRASALGPNGKIYRSFRYGTLAELDMLDTRLYGRDQQPASPADTAVINDPARQLLGADQEAWLFDRLYRSQARDVQWRIIGQQVMMAQLSSNGGVTPVNVDQWDGYAAARGRLFQHIIDTNIDNVVVLTGDIHSSWANDLAPNPYDPAAYDPATGRGAVAVEIVTPAVTSPGIEDPQAAAQTAAGLRAISPHMKFIELNKRGYVVVDVNRDRMQADWYHVPTIREQTREQLLAAVFTCESGASHLQPAGSPLAAREDDAELAP